MLVNEAVSLIHAFPGVTSLCGYGCLSGKIGVFDSETNQHIFSFVGPESLNTLIASDEKILYFSDKNRIASYDLRAKQAPVEVFRTVEEITSFSIRNDKLAICNSENGMLVYDTRNMKERLDMKKNDRIPDICCFNQNNEIIVSYSDLSVCMFKHNSDEIFQLEVSESATIQGIKPMGMFCIDNTLIIGYYSGISIYENYNLKQYYQHSLDSTFSSVTAAPCFSESTVAYSTSEGNIYPLCTSSKSPSRPVKLNGVNINRISANHLMIAVADDQDDGYIGVMMPEDYGIEN